MGGVYVHQLDREPVFKLGFSKSPEKRIKQLGTGNPGQWTPFEFIETPYPSRCETDAKGLLLPFRRRGIDAKEIYDVEPSRMLAVVEAVRGYAEDVLPKIAEAEQLGKSVSEDRVVSPTDVVHAKVTELLEVKSQMHTLRRKEKRLEAEVKLFMRTASRLDGHASWTTRYKTELNRVLLVKEQPAIFERYQQTTYDRPFKLL